MLHPKIGNIRRIQNNNNNNNQLRQLSTMTATFSTNNLLRLVPSYTSGSHIPVWTDLQPYETTPTFPKLAANLRTDVIVVGAGIAGLSTAYELVERGKNVIVLDDGATVASGESGRTTCHLTSALDERYYNLVSLLGASNARKAFESHQWAIHRIHEIVNKHGIECDFTRINGYLISKASRLDTNYDRDELRKEFETCRDLGIPVEYRMAVGAPVPGKPSLTHENFNTVPGLNGTDVGDAVVFGGQAMCHPTKYLDALAKILTEDDGASSTTSTSQRRGTCQIFTHTHAQTMKGGKDEAYVLTSDGYRITAKDLVMATNMPETNLISMVDKLIPCRTYVIAAKIPSEAMPDCLIWDTYEPYHYVRTQNSAEPGLKWIIVGGEDHRVGQDLHEPVDERFRRLEAWTRERFPAMREVGYKWSGQIIEPIGSLASIGRNPGDYQNVYIVTGDVSKFFGTVAIV